MDLAQLKRDADKIAPGNAQTFAQHTVEYLAGLDSRIDKLEATGPVPPDPVPTPTPTPTPEPTPPPQPGPPATGKISWRGDYETGDAKQWDNGVQCGDLAAQFKIVTSPVRQGKYAARITVRPGDHYVSGGHVTSGERCEPLIKTVTADCQEGKENWWAWSTMFDSSYQPTGEMWNYFLQFRNTVNAGQSNVMISAPDKRIVLGYNHGADYLHPTSDYHDLVTNRVNGKWYDFVVHAKWSSDPAKGLFEIWVDGKRPTAALHGNTLWTGQSVYVKQGLYRKAQSTTAVLYHDGARRGSSWSAVVADFPAGVWPATPPA